MRVEKSQIIEGIASYVENEVIPKISDDRAAQIIISVWINSLKTNQKLVDSILDQGFVKALLDKDENGMYEIENLFRTFADSVEKYGYFPVNIPPIPLISPTEKALKFDKNDILEIKRRIERGS